MYYEDKIQTLKSMFGVKDIALQSDSLTVGQERFPILHDVIILSDPTHYTGFVKAALRARTEGRPHDRTGFAEDIQFTFGEEWKAYSEILPEHQQELAQYFDLVDLNSFRHARVCDLGCGNGRWSYLLKDRCRELILVDFSDAIFLARKNLALAPNCLFFMGDLQALPFKKDFCDFVFCLGVLHHLPLPCLEAVRRLREFAPRLLVFLYYALDNRPVYFRVLLKTVTLIRRILCRIRHPELRKLVARAGALVLYRPLIGVGKVLRPFKLSRYVPLYEFYHTKSLRRIEQDVYDRFFTRIEQRVSRNQIRELGDTFAQVIVSDNIPYWHFLCVR
ncbi:MAG: class I SAM-dependent methyltransferase [Nitrospirae bacterium]|nr:class I SAM-dependent methyltransferase [Nitrospirota bacterium]